jgi:hypothetical protein
MRTPAESQLPLPFELSAPSRLAAARKRTPATPAAERRLFPLVPQLDVSLHTASEAMAVISGAEWEATLAWLEAIVGPTRPLRSRRVAFPAGHLDRLVSLRPPAQVSLDAAATAVARALWAARLGLAPLEVNLSARRLVASSRRWPAGFAVRDAPWTAISALLQLRVPLTVDPQARKLMRSRLATTGTHVATAALAGSAVLIETEQPAIIEALGLPALAYAGLKGTGLYRMPLLAAEPLLSEPAVRLGVELEAAIRKATQRPRPLRRPTETFPWELYGFQARDAADAERILRTTGGVLLAGDMGSGKTTVSLALAAKLELWPLLVVSPLAAFSTWQRQLDEMGRQAPTRNRRCAGVGTLAWRRNASTRWSSPTTGCMRWWRRWNATGSPAASPTSCSASSRPGRAGPGDASSGGGAAGPDRPVGHAADQHGARRVAAGRVPCAGAVAAPGQRSGTCRTCTSVPTRRRRWRTIWGR